MEPDSKYISQQKSGKVADESVTGFLLALRQNKPGSIQIIPLMLPYEFALTEEKHDVIAVKCTRQTRYIYPVWNVSMQHG